MSNPATTTASASEAQNPQATAPKLAGGFFSSLTARVQSALPASLNESLSGFKDSSIHNQIRGAVNTFTGPAPIRPIQGLITALKGVGISSESAGAQHKLVSKRLVDWGQHEHADLDDITDRLAQIHYLIAEVYSAHASKLIAARAHVKELRDLEASLLPRRRARDNLHEQIAREKNEGVKAKLREDLERLTRQDEKDEREIEVLKRRAVRATWEAEFAAVKEFGQKLVLAADHGTSLVSLLSADPPTSANPYASKDRAASLVTSLETSLHVWRPSLSVDIPHSESTSAAAPERKLSFKDSHAAQLNDLSSVHPAGTASNPPPPAHATSSFALPTSSQPPGAYQQAPPVGPSAAAAAGLNLSPTLLPTPGEQHFASPPPPAEPPHRLSNDSGASPPPAQTDLPLTVAETGAPVKGGGPKSGSLAQPQSQQQQGRFVAPPPPGAAAGSSAPAPAPAHEGEGFPLSTAAQRKADEAAEERRQAQASAEGHVFADQPPPGYSPADAANAPPAAGDAKEPDLK